MKSLGQTEGIRVIPIELMEYEWEALLEAIRRDMRSETLLLGEFGTATEEGSIHGYAARMDVRILERLSPKHPDDIPVSVVDLSTA